MKPCLQHTPQHSPLREQWEELADQDELTLLATCDHTRARSYSVAQTLLKLTVNSPALASLMF